MTVAQRDEAFSSGLFELCRQVESKHDDLLKKLAWLARILQEEHDRMAESGPSRVYSSITSTSLIHDVTVLAGQIEAMRPLIAAPAKQETALDAVREWIVGPHVGHLSNSR
jgi:hypothetical protein